MIFTDKHVNASGPRNARLAAIGMAPAKQELAEGMPFVGPSGRIFNDALDSCRTQRANVYVTNMVEFFVDDNDLYSIPPEIMEAQRARVLQELEVVRPNCLLVMGGPTLTLLMEGYVGPEGAKRQRAAAQRWAISKWRGSIFELTLPSGRKQKCVAAMHPAGFIRGQWKWLPLYKYIDVSRAATQSSFPEMRLTPREAIVGPSFRVAMEWLQEANQQHWVSIDYEGRNHITCLGVGWDSSRAICIPLSRVGSACYWSKEEESALWKSWCDLLQNPKVKKIAQNAAYEWIKSWNYGIYPNPLGMDTMLAHHCLYPDWGGVDDEWNKKKRDIDNPGHGLALITSQYTDQPFYKDEGRHWTPEMGEDRFWRYNALDVMVTFEAAMKMLDELESTGLRPTYERKYLGEFEPALRMEWFGIAIDVAHRAEARSTLQAELDEIAARLADSIGMKVIAKGVKGAKPQAGVLNLSSPKQMQEFVYGTRGYKVRVKKETQRPTVDKETLAALAIKHDDDALRAILRMRSLQDLINDVIDQPLDANGRLHCHFKIGGTNGTRWSSTESILGGGTNLQNLPRQGVARSLFLPT